MNPSHDFQRLSCTAAAFAILVLFASCDGGTRAASSYPSPTAVFDAFCKARNQRDWRRCFLLMTPEAQQDAVFETFFACGVSGSKETAEICARYVDRRRLDTKIDNAHAKTNEDKRAVMRDALWSSIDDKAGFYGAASSQLMAGRPISPFGPLEQLTFDGNTASGRAQIETSHLEQSDTESSSREIKETGHREFTFKKFGGGWLIDK